MNTFALFETIKTILMAFFAYHFNQFELLRAKLSSGVGHNSYGEQAWSTDLLYMFPISIRGIFGAGVGLACLAPTVVGEPANPYATPYEILPEWFLFPTLQSNRGKLAQLLDICIGCNHDISNSSLPFLEIRAFLPAYMFGQNSW